jgi:hypothetical protein
MQKILNKREKIVLYITVGIIIFSIAFNLFIGPALSRNETLNKEINIVRLKLNKYLNLLSQKEYIQDKYNKFSASLKLDGSGEDTFVGALSEIEGLAKASNISILDVRPQSPKILDLYKENLIELRTEGQIEGYLKFIYNIENSLSLLKIKRFQLNAKPNTALLEGSFSISQLSY